MGIENNYAHYINSLKKIGFLFLKKFTKLEAKI